MGGLSMNQSIQQIQERINHMRNDLAQVAQICNQLQQLPRMSQSEGNAAQQLQRIGQTIQHMNQDLSQIASAAQPISIQGYQPTQFAGQYGQGQQIGGTPTWNQYQQYGQQFNRQPSGQQFNQQQFGVNPGSAISATTWQNNQISGQRQGQFSQYQNYGQPWQYGQYTQGQQYGQSQISQQQSGQDFQNLGTYGLSSAQASYMNQMNQQQNQPYQYSIQSSQYSQYAQ